MTKVIYIIYNRKKEYAILIKYPLHHDSHSFAVPLKALKLPKSVVIELPVGTKYLSADLHIYPAEHDSEGRETIGEEYSIADVHAMPAGVLCNFALYGSDIDHHNKLMEIGIRSLAAKNGSAL